MLHILNTTVELSSKTSHSAFNGTTDGRAVLYRSEIDDDGAEISPLYHFSHIGGPYLRGEIDVVRRDRYQSE